jgi:uncharacterized glyoxalase superfamily protein PhnB
MGHINPYLLFNGNCREAMSFYQGCFGGQLSLMTIGEPPMAKDMAPAYLDKLQAPIKGFYAFEQSAHSPMFEEPEKLEQIMQQDVLAGTNRLDGM